MPEIGVIVAVYLALFVFGYVYNYLVVERIERAGYDAQEWWLVVLGVAATVAACVILIGLPNALLVGGGFVASGFWMIAGALSRRERRIRKHLERIEDEQPATPARKHG